MVATRSRWENTTNPTVLTLPELSRCPDYNMWHYGFGGRFTPFVVNSLRAHEGDRAMFEAYATRDVIYLMGQNDTCNEYLTPRCQSHGLDKSCAGMLEGHFRRERAENYLKFLAAFFGRPVHRGSLVPASSLCPVMQPDLPVDPVMAVLPPLVMLLLFGSHS